MKTSSLKFLILGTSLFSLAAQASMTLDMPTKMSKLLGHPAQMLNIFDVNKTNLDQGATKFQPWSGSYWPDISGGIADHYRIHSVVGTEARFFLGYGVAKARFQGDHNDVMKKYNQWDAKTLNQNLSPTEKYDLLLGDTNFTFTQNVMDELDFRAKYRTAAKRTAKSRDSSEDDNQEGYANNYFYEDDDKTYDQYTGDIQYMYWSDRHAKLVYWSGICDGWSPASSYLPRPVQPVTVTGALGHQITFYPDDLKALGSYLFARTNTPFFTTMNYQYAGKSCLQGGKPDTDDKGYVKDVRCNDLDPGVWYLALINRVALDGMGFMMDVNNDKKINNHAITGYQFTYFNPKTGKAGSMRDSAVTKGEFNDAYAKRRNPKTAYIVGVKSKVNYVFYLLPEADGDQVTDSPAHDKVKELDYVFDLELDAAGNVLGGEWGDRSNESGDKVKYSDQPDFIWMAAPQNLAYSQMSLYATPGVKLDASKPRPFGNMQWAWDGQSALPEDWVRAAHKDEEWAPPVVVNLNGQDYRKVVPPMEARNSNLKSAQPLSHIVYYLFDQARDSQQQ